MAIRLPSHLHRARSGILHFRIAIPPDLRQHFTIREIYRSLRTASVRDAAPAAQTLAQAVKRAFQQLNKKTPTGPFDGSEWASSLKLGSKLRRCLVMQISSDGGLSTYRGVRAN
jgi:hypothetical protein